jgi:superfamily I DNA/RNA helicase
METTIFGPPGTGKTTRLINIVKDELDRGTAPDKIAFMSFSKKAAEEARERAAQSLGIDDQQMIWFRTLHSFAFNVLGMNSQKVLKGADYNKIGDLLGLPMQSTASLKSDEGILFSPGQALGDQYHSIIQLARVTGNSLEDQFNKQWGNNRLHYQQLKLVDQVITDYKKQTDKIDFVDMIERFVVRGECPLFDVLIIDEAQDLVPLQWRMVHEVIKPNAKRVYYAGDDDQCIYSWMGVNVSDFLNASEHKVVLDKSYRLPRQVYDLADSMVKGLDVRQQKVWSPTDKTGSVVWHHDILDVDITTGEWLILARTNNIANRIANMLKEQGFLFWRDGGAGWSVSSNVLNGIEVWLQLCKNQFVSPKDLKILQKLLHPSMITKSGRRKLTNLDPEAVYNLTDLQKLCGVTATVETPWYDALKVSENERIYITSVRRRGESILSGKPRIRISTIHKAKGGEADNVLLSLESSPVIKRLGDSQEEIRTFYVGMTRARKSLHIVDSFSNYRFEL